MEWLARNSPAVQAIASIVGVVIAAVLAGITWRYVRLTRHISESSLEQVKLIKETARIGHQQNLLALKNLAFRMRISLEPVSLTRAGIMSFSQPTEVDIADLEDLARQSNSASILKFARVAV